MVNEIKVEAKLKSGIGKKSGKPYTCIEVKLPNGYTKVIFPDGAEKFVFEQCLSN